MERKQKKSLAGRAVSAAFSLASYIALSILMFLVALRKYIVRIFLSLAISLASGIFFFVALSLAFFFFVNNLLPKEAWLVYWLCVAVFFLLSVSSSVAVGLFTGLASFIIFLLFPRLSK